MDWIDRVKQDRDAGIITALDQSQHEAVNSRFPGTTLEYCCTCGEPTGRAGAGDDSLFDIDGGGPYCWDCWKKLSPELRDDE